MTVLLVEQPSKSSQALQLQAALGDATGWRVLLVESINEASKHARKLRGQVKIAIITTGRNYEPSIQLIREMKECAALNGFEYPRTLVLSHVTQRPDVAVIFEQLGAEYLLRAYSEQIVEVVRKLQWQSRTGKFPNTIVLRRLGGRGVAITVKSSSGEFPVDVGPRLRTLMEYLIVHSRTTHTTEMIADAMGVSRQSVKEYLLRLRQAFDNAREKAGVVLTGERLLSTQRLSGGYVHGIKANVEIQDDDVSTQHAPCCFR